jgi:hypothetical protein
MQGAASTGKGTMRPGDPVYRSAQDAEGKSSRRPAGAGSEKGSLGVTPNIAVSDTVLGELGSLFSYARKHDRIIPL